MFWVLWHRWGLVSNGGGFAVLGTSLGSKMRPKPFSKEMPEMQGILPTKPKKIRSSLTYLVMGVAYIQSSESHGVVV